MPNSPYETRRPGFDPVAWAAYEAASDRAHRQYIATPIACVWGQGAILTLCRICREAACFSGVCKACRDGS